MKVSNKRKAEMWCDLNRYKIPKELEDVVSSTEHYSVASEMKKIADDIGIDACLKEWRRQVAPTLEEE